MCKMRFVYVCLALFMYAYEESQKTETPISICNVFFVSRGNLLEFY